MKQNRHKTPQVKSNSAIPPAVPRRTPAPRFLVIRNPVAGWQRGRAYRACLRALQAAGAGVEVRETTGPGDATLLARDAEPHFDGVIAAGGDGTINEVVNGLAMRPPDLGPPPPLGAFPLGTANVYAAEVGLPFEPSALADCLTKRRTRPLQLGLVTPLGGGAERHFVLMAGAGFDAQVVDKVDPAVKRYLGKAAYALETVGAFVRADAHRPTLLVDGRELATSSAIVVNARYYGGRFVLSKSADPFAPSMDLCLFHKAGRQAIFGYLVRVALGLIEDSPVYSIERVSSFDITGPDGAPIQADGDIVARAPVRISMAERSLAAIVPAPG